MTSHALVFFVTTDLGYIVTVGAAMVVGSRAAGRREKFAIGNKNTRCFEHIFDD